MPPIVSVLMTTYNHEGVISQALESAVSQKTNFPFEIVIGEDCSTDRTREIVLEYQQRHPDLIRALLPERNLGMLRNTQQTLDACTGKFIASLEGDDYWTSDDKLQRQVDYLNAHPECMICYHRVVVLDQITNRSDRTIPVNPKPIATIEDLLPFNFIPTCSAMWRNGKLGTLPEWIAEVKFADWIINVFNAQHGKIGFIDECMGVYRLHGGGTWSTQTWHDVMTRWITAYGKMNEHLGGRSAHIFREAPFDRRYWFALDRVERGDSEARRHVWAAAKSPPVFSHALKKARLLACAYLPGASSAARKVKRALRSLTTTT